MSYVDFVDGEGDIYVSLLSADILLADSSTDVHSVRSALVDLLDGSSIGRKVEASYVPANYVVRLALQVNASADLGDDTVSDLGEVLSQWLTSENSAGVQPASLDHAADWRITKSAIDLLQPAAGSKLDGLWQDWQTMHPLSCTATELDTLDLDYAADLIPDGAAELCDQDRVRARVAESLSFLVTVDGPAAWTAQSCTTLLTLSRFELAADQEVELRAAASRAAEQFSLVESSDVDVCMAALKEASGILGIPFHVPPDVAALLQPVVTHASFPHVFGLSDDDAAGVLWSLSSSVGEFERESQRITKLQRDHGRSELSPLLLDDWRADPYGADLATLLPQWSSSTYALLEYANQTKKCPNDPQVLQTLIDRAAALHLPAHEAQLIVALRRCFGQESAALADLETAASDNLSRASTLDLTELWSWIVVACHSTDSDLRREGAATLKSVNSASAPELTDLLQVKPAFAAASLRRLVNECAA